MYLLWKRLCCYLSFHTRGKWLKDRWISELPIMRSKCLFCEDAIYGYWSPIDGEFYLIVK